MRCEVIAIGTELLLGIIVDSNSAWLGEQLALAGINSYFQVKVGDNFARIEACIRQALERSDAVICCGGLGPTQDDITRDVIARVMGVKMRRDEAIAAKIRHIFESRGRVMSVNNLLQANIPIGAQPIAQMPGTAPGLVCPIGNKVVYAVPGRAERDARDDARHDPAGSGTPGRQGLGDQEPRAAHLGHERVRAWPRCWSSASTSSTSLAIRPSPSRPAASTASRCASSPSATTTRPRLRILDAEEKLIRGLLGDVIFGIDEQSMETVVLDLLRRQGLTVAAAETMTGGILSARMSAADAGDGDVPRRARLRPHAWTPGGPDAGAARRRGRRAGARGVRHTRRARGRRAGGPPRASSPEPSFSPPTSRERCTPRT